MALTGKTVATTYHSLLKVSNTDNQNFDTTLRDIVDGEDTASCLKLATDKATVTLGGDAGDDFVVTGSSASKSLVVEGESGQVGIGTAAPASKLHLGGVDSGAQGITWQSGTSGTDYRTFTTTGFSSSASGNYLSFNIANAQTTQLSNVLYLRGDGNIGIGTASPDTKLEVETDGADQEVRLSCHSDTEAHTSTLSFLKSDNTAASPATIDSGAVIGTIAYYGYDDNGYDTGAKIVVAADANWSSTERGTKMSFYTRDANESISENLTIAADGKVGIGDNAPPSNLHIKGSGGISLGLESTDNDENLDIDYYDNGGNAYGRIRWDEGPCDWTFQTNVTASSSNVMNINYNNTGKVGIGTSAPDGRLECEVADGGNLYCLVLDQNDSTNNPQALYIDNAGTGDSIRDDSGAKLTAAGVWTDASDINRKKDIEAISYGLSSILALNPKKFKWKRTDTDDLGFIAQDVEKVLPELVEGEDCVLDGDKMIGGKTLQSNGIIAVLVKAIQELSAKVEALENA